MQGMVDSAAHTLRELRYVPLPLRVAGAVETEPCSLTRFAALRSLTLCGLGGPGRSLLARLPTGLRDLTLVADPGIGSQSQGWLLQMCAPARMSPGSGASCRERTQHNAA